LEDEQVLGQGPLGERLHVLRDEGRTLLRVGEAPHRPRISFADWGRAIACFLCSTLASAFLGSAAAVRDVPALAASAPVSRPSPHVSLPTFSYLSSQLPVMDLGPAAITVKDVLRFGGRGLVAGWSVRPGGGDTGSSSFSLWDSILGPEALRSLGRRSKSRPLSIFLPLLLGL
jgi:hypothetical protein